MSNKIEEGCLAIIVNAAHKEPFEANVGKVVKVGKYIGKPNDEYEYEYECNDNWETNPALLTVTVGK